MGKVSKLTPGKHGFHVHEKGDTGNSCVAAGGHFNPKNVNHGGLDADIRHDGDFGNIDADAEGVATVSITKDG